MLNEVVIQQSVLSWIGVWIVIPAYNEEATIRSLAERALKVCSRVIIVDDASTDSTVLELQGLPVRLLSQSSNRGKAACLLLGFGYASEREALCVITLDGDGQHNPFDASRLLSAWLCNANRIIIGARLHDRLNFPPVRYYANRIACFWISWAAGHSIADSQSGFRLYPAKIIEVALSGKVTGRRFTFESEILIVAAQFDILTLAVPISGCYPLNARASHFRPVVDIIKIIWMVASKLMAQKMAPSGLLRCLKPPQIWNEEENPLPSVAVHRCPPPMQ
jgi:glycosyltransferase involved in cell wall biosynthesis